MDMLGCLPSYTFSGVHLSLTLRLFEMNVVCILKAVSHTPCVRPTCFNTPTYLYAVEQLDVYSLEQLGSERPGRRSPARLISNMAT